MSGENPVWQGDSVVSTWDNGGTKRPLGGASTPLIQGASPMIGASTMDQVTKPCSKCGERLPLEDFAKDSAGRLGRRSQCRPCKASMDRDYLLRVRFGITSEVYDSLLREQGGRCALCSTDAPGGRWPRFGVDHCHSTGRVRGLLCRSCNTALGALGDTPERLLAAYRYVAGKESTGA